MGGGGLRGGNVTTSQRRGLRGVQQEVTAQQEVEALADRGEGVIRGSTSFEHLWTRTCDSVFGAPKTCVEPTEKNAFQIWTITNHKSQICDCNAQTQMIFGNAPLLHYVVPF